MKIGVLSGGGDTPGFNAVILMLLIENLKSKVQPRNKYGQYGRDTYSSKGR